MPALAYMIVCAPGFASPEIQHHPVAAQGRCTVDPPIVRLEQRLAAGGDLGAVLRKHGTSA